MIKNIEKQNPKSSIGHHLNLTLQLSLTLNLKTKFRDITIYYSYDELSVAEGIK